MPIGVAPAALHGLAHPDGELATARAAAAAGAINVVSTVASRSIEEIAAASGDGRRWFQLYVAARLRRSPAASSSERPPPATRRSSSPWTLPVLGYRDDILRRPPSTRAADAYAEPRPSATRGATATSWTRSSTCAACR